MTKKERKLRDRIITELVAEGFNQGRIRFVPLHRSSAFNIAYYRIWVGHEEYLGAIKETALRNLLNKNNTVVDLAALIEKSLEVRKGRLEGN